MNRTYESLTLKWGLAVLFNRQNTDYFWGKKKNWAPKTIFRGGDVDKKKCFKSQRNPPLPDSTGRRKTRPSRCVAVSNKNRENRHVGSKCSKSPFIGCWHPGEPMAQE